MHPTEPSVALATDRDHPTLTADDRLLLAALRGRGVDATPAVWTDPSVDWASFDAVVVRSCWDYHERPETFCDWVEGTAAAGTPVYNDPDLIRWNAHKSYLPSLADAGHRVIPTAVIDRGEDASLEAECRDQGWDEVVVKPAVSAGADDTWRSSLERASADQSRFERTLATGDTLVQRYEPGVGDGEWSVLFFDGTYSHAVRKYPAPGDFRVQSAFGGEARSERPGASIRESARAILEDVPGDGAPLYARVDGIERDGAFLCMEVECIEPNCFLEADDDAPDQFADAVCDRLDVATG